MTTTFVGICSIDLYSRIDRLPHNGETLKGIDLNRGFGGKASNACAQFAFLATQDEKPSLLTCVGKDSDGDSIRAHFQNININNDLVIVSEKQPTGLAICFVLDKGESAIVIHPCSLTPSMVRKYSDKISQSKFVVTNFEIPIEVAAETLKIAHQGGAKTILNFAPAPSTPCDKEIFRNTSICIANEVEMAALGTSVEELHSLGVECVIETLGGKGANIHVNGKDVIHVDAPKVEVVDTTGAGDSFLGSLTYFLSKGKSYEEASKFACFAASQSVQRIGTQQSYCRRGDEVLAPFFA
ncbi:kinase, pfkB family protein [Tritrichomonas foetus]|uniref:Ribokinase n=1 Tax=Tritrichomonas foetus TaxID=1144522 RepID=A0A1J4KD72_9EUKA|nr:kinase, pfkB family protein [Tritrichomonas foetus]|eukprot:OHT09377.1 kinase, pfkB family protein [Tritrichomonas foetus]